jgi:hypothetical protein
VEADVAEFGFQILSGFQTAYVLGNDFVLIRLMSFAVSNRAIFAV